VDRDAHEGRLYDLSLLESLRERLATEVPQARPQADVSGGGVLGLEAADPVERARDWKRGSLKQELSGQQRSVELEGRKDAFLQGPTRTFDLGFMFGAATSTGAIEPKWTNIDATLSRLRPSRVSGTAGGLRVYHRPPGRSEPFYNYGV
jgi:hypothetical protein